MMTDAILDLTALVGRMVDRKPGRTEANVQSDLHALLLVAPLQLEEGHLNDIILEQPAGNRLRIDVEAGFCVFEVKRDLRKGNVRQDAQEQLAGYVMRRSEQTGQRYVGVLTDGCEWHLYRLQENELAHVSTLDLNTDQPDLESLCVWLEGVLATGETVTPTPIEIARLLGAGTPGYLLNIEDLSDFYRAGMEIPAVRLKRQLWAKLLTTAQGTAFRDDDGLFVQHTLLVVVMLKVRSYQSRGEHNPRHIHKYPWQLPIPIFDSDDDLHNELVGLGAEAERFVSTFELPKTRFEKQRSFVREQVAASDIGKRIEAAVENLL